MFKYNSPFCLFSVDNLLNRDIYCISFLSIFNHVCLKKNRFNSFKQFQSKYINIGINIECHQRL